MNERSAKRIRRVAIGAGVAAATAVAAVSAERAAVRRLRGRGDGDGAEDLTELPPEATELVSFDGTTLHVRTAGPKGAPTLLFLHGITLDMTTWHFQWKRFSDRFRCVLFDHRAHGRSGTPPTGDYSLGAMGQDIRVVLDEVVPEGPVVLVGHSMGGMALLSFARQFPEEFGGRVAGAVFVDTAASDLLRDVFGNLGTRVGWAMRKVGDRYRKRLDAADRLRRRIRSLGADVMFLTAWASNFGPEASPAHVEHVARIAAEAPVEVWVHTLRDLIEMDLGHAVEHVRVPSLVVVGDRDLLTPKTSAQALRAALPDARAVVITRAGHIAMLERHEVFNEILDGYLQQMLAVHQNQAAVHAHR